MMPLRFVAASEFGRLVGCGKRRALRAFAAFKQGRAWCPRARLSAGPRTILPIHQAAGYQGAPLAWVVRRDAIPPEWLVVASHPAQRLLIARGARDHERAAAPADQKRSPSPSGIGETIARICTMRGDDAGAWRAAVTQEILSADARPADVIKALIEARLTYAWGKKRGLPVGESTLWDWCNVMKAPDGAAKLQRHGNEGRRFKRVLTWQALDRAMAHLPRERQEAIAEEVHRLAMAAYAGGAESAFNAAQWMLPYLRDIAEREGIPVPIEECAFRKGFTAPEGYMRRPDRLRARKANLAKRDAQTVSAKHLPRVRRHRKGLRFGDAIQIDVRHHDIKAMRDDGTERTALLVAIIDMATHRLVAYPFLLPKGENIRRAHVAMALRSYFSTWGVPAWIVADNGKELCGLRPQLNNIAVIAAEYRARHGFVYPEGARPPGLIRSRPYQPQGKGLIEGAFSILTKIEASLEGYLPGNRVQKRTRHLGQSDGPGAIGQDGVDQVVARAVIHYNRRPQQKGHIKGLSPDEAMQRDLAGGASLCRVNEAEFDLVFGTDETRIVNNGEIRFENRFYRADQLMAMNGEAVRLRVPILGDGTTMIVIDQRGVPQFTVHADTPRHVFAVDGAKESARLKRAGLAGLKATAQGAVPIDPASAMDRLAATLAPELPADAPIEKIEISPVVAKAATKARTRKQEGANEMKRQIAWLEQGKSNAA